MGRISIFMGNEIPISESVLDKYEILTPFDHNENVFLVKDRETKELFVEKVIAIHNPDLYLQMKEQPLEGVPRIYGIYSENGKTIIIEEYIHGLNLMQMTMNNGPWEEKKVVSLMSSLCHILNQLHRMNPPVIHKDIKPGNLILNQESRLYLIDFNISREVNPNSAIDTMPMVSPHFSAPEAYGFGQSDARSDIYSIGATMHYLLTGGYLKETKYDGPLKGIINKCTMMDPESRYQSVNELKKDLEEWGTYIGENKYDNSYGKIIRLLPPGFRSGKLWHMIIALIGYALIVALCFTMEIESTLREPFVVADLWVERIGVFIFFMLTIFILFNYRDCLNRIPGINRIKSGILKRLLCVFILFSVILTILVLFVSVMSGF